MAINLFQISENIKNKNYDKAEESLVEIIDNMWLESDLVPSSNVFTAQKNNDESCYAAFNHIASLISELFSSAGFKPSPLLVDTFLQKKFVIEWVFLASAWESTDPLIDHLGLMKPDQNGQVNFTEERLTLVLMLTGLSSKYKLPWAALFHSMPAKALTAYIGLVTQTVPALTEQRNQHFNYLLESAKDFPLFDLPILQDLSKFSFAYFNCSYATSPNKYELKKWLGRLIQKNINQGLTPDIKQAVAAVPQIINTQNKKMKVIVGLELYGRDHAMHRCFASYLEELSENYELIALSDAKDENAQHYAIFSEVIYVKDKFDINEHARLILAQNPDIIFLFWVLMI